MSKKPAVKTPVLELKVKIEGSGTSGDPLRPAVDLSKYELVSTHYKPAEGIVICKVKKTIPDSELEDWKKKKLVL